MLKFKIFLQESMLRFLVQMEPKYGYKIYNFHILLMKTFLHGYIHNNIILVHFFYQKNLQLIWIILQLKILDKIYFQLI